MAERTFKIYECDVCGAEGTRYQVVYEDGTKILDRCEKHNGRIEKLRDEKGGWIPPAGGKSTFKKSTVADLRAALERRT